jgi:lipid-binding SYLF domain-containing protein
VQEEMKRLLILCVVACLAIPTFAKDDEKDDKKAEDRIKAASSVLEEIESAPDQGIPEEVLGSAECVAVVPTMLKGGFIVGARYGRGVAC